MTRPTPWYRPLPDFYTLRIIDASVLLRVPSFLPVDYVAYQLYIGPSVRLAGPAGCAQLDSPELAEQFRLYALPILKKRQGEELALIVSTMQTPTKISLAKTGMQSAKIRSRLSL